MHLELNNTRFFFKIVISVLSSKFDYQDRDDNCKENIVIFLQYIDIITLQVCTFIYGTFM